MAQLAMLAAGLLLFAESQASDVADSSTFQGFLSKPMPSGYDASKSSMSDYDKFITPQFNSVKNRNGPDALFNYKNPAAGAEPSIGTKDFDLPRIADREENKAVQKLAATESNGHLGLHAMFASLLWLGAMLGVRTQGRRFQPADDKVLEMKSCQQGDSSRVGWGQLSSQHSEPLTLCYHVGGHGPPKTKPAMLDLDAMEASGQLDVVPDYVQNEAVMTGGGFNASGEPPVKVKGFSLATAALAAGAFITLYSFYAFFTSGGGGGTASVSSLGFIYGIPILSLGAALAYAELQPVPVTYAGNEAEMEALWEAKANEAMRSIREDVTRHRYGDDAHLDTTTKALGLVEPGRPYPVLLEIKLGMTDHDELSFAMVFQALEAPFSLWADERRVKKYQTFFGPNIDVDVVKVDKENRVLAIVLATNGGEPGASGLERGLKIDLTAEIPDKLPARNREEYA
jgi:hypothetical protein